MFANATHGRLSRMKGIARGIQNTQNTQNIQNTQNV